MPSWIVTEPPSPDVRIREAVEADLPQLVPLLTQLSLDEPREALGPPLAESYRNAFAEIAADPRQHLYVLEAAGRIAGSLVLVIVPNLTHQGTSYALVENVVVDEAERGKRYGELLMRHAIEEARRAGCYKLSLTSNKRRPEAHRFYERLGLRATSEGFRVDL
jgi:GNAT superfamily N-acetyltransferase